MVEQGGAMGERPLHSEAWHGSTHRCERASECPLSRKNTTSQGAPTSWARRGRKPEDTSGDGKGATH